MDATSNSKQLPPRPRFTKFATSIIDDAHALIESTRRAHDAIVKDVTVDTATFANVLKPLAHAENELDLGSYHLCFYHDVSPHEDVRKASIQAKDLFIAFRANAALRQDLYDLIAAVVAKKTDEEERDPESQRYLQRKYRAYRGNGLGIPPGRERERFKEIKKRVGQLVSEYRANLAKAPKEAIWLTVEELDGVPESVLDEIKAGTPPDGDDGKLRVPLEGFFISSIYSFAVISETRKRCARVFPNRCIENAPIFKEVLILRDEAARLLGFRNHAEYRLEDRMAQAPGVVNAFLDDLRSRVKRGGEVELARLRALKKIDLAKRALPADDSLFYTWDLNYYKRLDLAKKFSVDAELMSEYFVVDPTVGGMLEIYSHLFGLAFEELDNQPEDLAQSLKAENELTWHADVKTFAVHDVLRDGKKEFLGYFYMDLFKRPNRTGMDTNKNIQPGFLKANGERQYPATALFCNFNKPFTNRPTLLRHREIITLFHETGHALHNMVSKTRYSIFHGTNVADDFGEAPSQLLEHWCWTPSMLKSIGKHYSYVDAHHLQIWRALHPGQEQPKEKLPDDTIESLIRAKYAQISLATLQSLHLSIMDMTCYQPQTHEDILQFDVAATYNRLRRDLIPIEDHGSLGLGDGWAHGYTGWVHPVDNYDAGYYGYLFSQVFADDIWYSKFRTDPLNAEEGMRYRREVLEKGGSQDEMKTLRDYLGRMPETKAFYQELNL